MTEITIIFKFANTDMYVEHKQGWLHNRDYNSY
jgi:hypothetical protein